MQRRTVIFTGSLIATVAALSAILLRCSGSSTSPMSPERAELVEALGPIRPIEGRLTGLTYAPYRGGARHRLSPRARSVIRKIQRLAEERQSAASVSDAAVVALLDGRLDEAIRLLDRAVGLAPRDAKLLSDLAAARLARGKKRMSGEDLLAALEAATRAAQEDEDLPEAAFNRALVLEELGLGQQAGRAWAAYATREPARRWLAAMDRSHPRPESYRVTWELGHSELMDAVHTRDSGAILDVVSRFPQFTRESVEREFLPGWAEATTANEEERQLWLARSISVAHLFVTGDHLLRDALQTISTTGPSSLVGAPSSLRQAHSAFAMALREYNGAESAVARSHFEEAKEGFTSSGSPFRYWADFYVALCAYEDQNFQDAAHLLDTLAQDLPRRYPNLLARILWVRGLLHYEAGQPDRALQLYRLCLSIFQVTQEAENVAAVHNLIATSLDHLGQPDLAWHQRLQALRLLPTVESPRRVQNILGQAAIAANRQGFPRAALYIQNEAVARVEPKRQPRLCAIAHLQRAEILSSIAENELVDRDLLQASDCVDDIAGDSERRAIRADLAAIAATRRPSQNGLALLDDVIQEYEKTGYAFRLPQLYQQRAALQLERGDGPSTESDLLMALRLMNEQGKTIRSLRSRLEFLESRQSVYDDLLYLQMLLGRTEVALDVSDGMRSAFLAGMPGLSDATKRIDSAFEIRRLASSLPEGVQFVEYALVRDRLACWLLSRDDFVAVFVKSDVEKLESMVQSFVAALERGHSKEIVTLSSQLGKILWQPFEHRLHPGRRVVVIPDKVLWQLPFAALTAGTGRFVLADHIVSYAPSIRFFLDTARRKRPVTELPTVGVVADPAFDRRLFPHLPRLENATREARQVAAHYESSTIVRGKAATKAAFLDLLRKRDIVVFAGHAVTNSEHPLLSYLVLSPGPHDNGVMFVHEFFGLQEPLPQLVVLSACDSALGSRTARALVGGPAWSLLASGVSSVIASFWRVEDSQAPSQLELLHTASLGGLDAAVVLRTAQLDTLSNWKPGVPATWAAFSVFEGVTGKRYHAAFHKSSARAQGADDPLYQ